MRNGTRKEERRTEMKRSMKDRIKELVLNETSGGRTVLETIVEEYPEEMSSKGGKQIIMAGGRIIHQEEWDEVRAEIRRIAKKFRGI